MQEDVERLCRRYTTLNSNEIAYIKKLADVLPFLADTEEADVFINCACAGGESVVVAQASPIGGPSAYQHSVVGMHSKPINEPAVARTFLLGSSTKRVTATNQERSPVTQNAVPIRYREKLIGVLTYERLFGQENRNHTLRESKPSIERLFESIPMAHSSGWYWLAEHMEEALLIIDESGIVRFRNTAAQELYGELGYVEDVLGQEYDNICLTNLQSCAGCSETEISLGKYYLYVRSVPFPLPGMKMAIFIHDVTHVKSQEQELILKSVVIQEIHHRIKNNLQTISSLLRLQIRRTKSEDARTVLMEANSRIQTIAATHQLLSQQGVEQVRIQEVIETIKDNVINSFGQGQMNVLVYIEGDDFEVDSDIATTVALVVNELMQNSLEHGFREKTSGTIRIQIQQEPLSATISITDNGRGFDHQQSQHLGLNIVRALVQEKLKGSLDIVSGLEGTCVKFDFLI